MAQDEAKMRYISYGAAVTLLFGARLTLDPKGALKFMVKNKQQFESDNDERVTVAREATRWAGILLFTLSAVVYKLSKAPLTATGEVQQGTREIFNAIGAGLVLDGLIVKLFGFLGSGVFTLADSLGGGITDISLGLFFLKGI